MNTSFGETRHIVLSDTELTTAIAEYAVKHHGMTARADVTEWDLTGVKRTEGARFREGSYNATRQALEASTEFRFTKVVIAL